MKDVQRVTDSFSHAQISSENHDPHGIDLGIRHPPAYYEGRHINMNSLYFKVGFHLVSTAHSLGPQTNQIAQTYVHPVSCALPPFSRRVK